MPQGLISLPAYVCLFLKNKQSKTKPMSRFISTLSTLFALNLTRHLTSWLESAVVPQVCGSVDVPHPQCLP